MQPCKPSTSKAMLGQAKRSESCKPSAQQAQRSKRAQRSEQAQRLGNKKAPELIVSFGAFFAEIRINQINSAVVFKKPF